MEISKQTSSQSTENEANVPSTIALTATLAIAGTVIPVAFSLASTTAERIEAIHRVGESGAVQLVNISDGSSIQAAEPKYDKIKGP